MTALEEPGTDAASVLDGREPQWDKRNGIGYLAGIDGLRAVSAAAVVAYHLDLGWAAGGYLGVEVFFVLSGYLITRLLLDEHRRTSTIDRGAFWIRRARRLLPAVFALIVGVVAWSVVIVGGADFSAFRGDALASALYVQNWWAIVADQPYFEAFGRPSPLRHVWSLAIEEQFYLLWPLLLPLALRRFGRRRTAVMLVPAIGLSVLAMSLTADIAAPERAYYGTDTRAFGLLIGCLLAFGWRPERMRASVDAPARRVLDAVGALALATLLWQFANRSEFDPWTYPRGFLLVDAATVALLVAATHPATAISRRLGTPALAALGRRSYSLYLWHWPVIVYTRPGIDWGLQGMPALVVRLALIAVLAECSYRFVEQPFRDGRARLVLASLVTGARQLRWPRFLAAAVTATTLGAAAAVTVAPAPVYRVQIQTSRAPIVAPTTSAVTATSAATTTTTTTAAPPPTTAPARDEAPEPFPVRPLTVVGESVTLGAYPAMFDHYGERMLFDAAEGRRASDSIALVERLGAEGHLAPTVVVHIGNNGALPVDGTDRLVAAVGPDRVLVLVTVRVPRRWEGQVNDEIRRAADAHPNVRIADWQRIANEDTTLLHSDGVHLSATGKRRYLEMIQAIQP